MNFMKKNSAFSLIELSIVILVIGILVAGVTQASRLVKQFRIRAAQTMTHSSPVHSIRDLTVWFEPTLESSFISSEAQNNSNISTWYDTNSQYSIKNNAVQATSANQPIYVDTSIGNLPAVRFDGTNDSLPFDGTFLHGTNYTIFVVEQRTSSAAPNYFIGGSLVGATTLHLGYISNDYVRFGQYSAGFIDYGVAIYASPIPRMHTFLMSQTAGKSYWMNGGTTAEVTNAAQLTPLSNYVGAAIGATYGTAFFAGDVSEIIIFTRALKTEERQAIETYLGKKYNIAIS